jgi:hypothetical protein
MCERLRFIFTFLAFALSLCAPSFAEAKGGADGGGGDAVKCAGGLFGTFAPDGTHLADLDINPNYSNYSYSSLFSFLTLSEARTGLLTFLQDSAPDEYAQVSASLAQLHFMPTEDRLVDVATGVQISTSKKLLRGCEKVQLAFQDFDTHNVYVYQPTYQRLPVLEQALLEIHEAYINIFHGQTSDLLKLEKLARAKVKTFYVDQYGGDLTSCLVHAHYGLWSKPMDGGYAATMVKKCSNDSEMMDAPSDPAFHKSFAGCIEDRIKSEGWDCGFSGQTDQQLAVQAQNLFNAASALSACDSTTPGPDGQWFSKEPYDFNDAFKGHRLGMTDATQIVSECAGKPNLDMTQSIRDQLEFPGKDRVIAYGACIVSGAEKKTGHYCGLTELIASKDFDRLGTFDSDAKILSACWVY